MLVSMFFMLFDICELVLQSLFCSYIKFDVLHYIILHTGEIDMGRIS